MVFISRCFGTNKFLLAIPVFQHHMQWCFWLKVYQNSVLSFPRNFEIVWWCWAYVRLFDNLGRCSMWVWRVFLKFSHCCLTVDLRQIYQTCTCFISHFRPVTFITAAYAMIYRPVLAYLDIWGCGECSSLCLELMVLIHTIASWTGMLGKWFLSTSG